MEEFLNILKITYGIVFILFLPGHIISYIFFPLKKIDVLERIGLSFALSIAIVPLLVFYLNLLGIPINYQSVTMQILLLMTISLIAYLIKMVVQKSQKF